MSINREPRSRAGVDPDAGRLGAALKLLRERLRLTQEVASSYAEPQMSSQYWGMFETGRVGGIFKPAVQRRLVEALNRAASPDPPLTVDDLANALDEVPASAKLLSKSAGYEEAIFPTRDGHVTMRYPANMSSHGLEDLSAYFAVFVRVRGGR